MKRPEIGPATARAVLAGLAAVALYVGPANGESKPNHKNTQLAQLSDTQIKELGSVSLNIFAFYNHELLEIREYISRDNSLADHPARADHPETVVPDNSQVPSSAGDTACSAESYSGGSLDFSVNSHKAWDFFISKAGLTAVQTAGVMGNLYAQDGAFNPEQVQYPQGGNSPTPTTQEDLGWGLAQWTPTGGVNPIIPAAVIAGVPSNQLGTLNGQLKVILSEMKTGSPPGVTDMISLLRQQNTISGAAEVFLKDFEGGGYDSPSIEISYADAMMKEYGDGDGC